MKLIIILSAAASIGASIILMTDSILAALGGRKAAKTLEHFLSEKEEEKPFPAMKYIIKEEDVLWLSLEPGLVGSIAGMMPVFLVGSVAGLLVGAVTRNVMLIVASALLLIYPVMRVRGKVKDMKEEVVMGIPPLASLISALLLVMPSVENAIERAKDMPGLVGQLLDKILSRARQSSKPLFGRGEEGALLHEARRFNLEPLTAFFAQLEGVAHAGTGGAEMMEALADALRREHRGRLADNLEKLENNLILPMSIFFFIPFLAGILLPILVGLFEQL